MIKVKEIKNEKAALNIVIDETADNPRNWDCLSTMVCFHGRYSLGDNHNYNSGDYSGWEEVEEAIRKDHDIGVLLPLYLYDHSGITISTTPFSCRWDSGQVGFIFVTKEDIKKEFGLKRVSKKAIERAEEILMSELEIYDSYLRGDVYGFTIENSQGELLESLGGFYGYDAIKYMKDEVPEEYHDLFDGLTA